MPASVIAEYDEDCDCSDEGCPTWAHITKWSCDCVKVEIHDDSAPCSGCSAFSLMRHTCSKGDDTGTYPDGSYVE